LAAEAQLVGIDIGGTAVKLGAATRDGSVVDETSIDVGRRGTEAILDEVCAAAAELAGGRLSAIGTGVPGLLDRAEGRVLASPNLPWLAGVGIRDELARRLSIEPARVHVENDANVAALGELWCGALRGVRHGLLATLGTGIGGGLILDGRLYVGEGMAGEIGHVTIEPGGLECGCGSRGCLETLASATGARRRAEAAGLPKERPGDLRALADAARRSDGPERELLHAVGRDLGHGLASVVCLLDLRTFVFGGGFSGALDTLEAGIRQGLSEWAYGERVSTVRLVRARLGPSAGWIGAASLARAE